MKTSSTSKVIASGRRKWADTVLNGPSSIVLANRDVAKRLTFLCNTADDYDSFLNKMKDITFVLCGHMMTRQKVTGFFHKKIISRQGFMT